MSEKKKVTLSLDEQVNELLNQLSKKNNMTKSGLVTYLINSLENNGLSGNIYVD